MSFDAALKSIGFGLGLTTYGGIKYLTANQAPDDAIIQEKNIGLAAVVAGVATVAVGVGLIYSGATPPSTPTCAISTIDWAAPMIQEAASCPINALRDILNYGGNHSLTAKTFEVLHNTQGISCDNYLPWKDTFDLGQTDYIDGIKAAQLHRPVVWGIDPWKRPFIAIKYVCEQAQVGAVALFQRYSDSGDPLVIGGWFPPQGFTLGSLRPRYQTGFLGNLTSFFQGKALPFDA